MTATKKKNVSKKNKSSWRKHTDTNDVDAFLEDQRLEERLGINFTNTPDEQIFQIDRKPDEENKPKLSAKEKKKLYLNRPLKCFTMLEPLTKVPDPITKRNRVRTKEERRNLLVKLKEEKNKREGILKAKEKQSLKDRQKYAEKKKQTPKTKEFNMNVWAEDEKLPIEQNEWITPNAKKHNLIGVGKMKKKIRKSVQEKTSNLPSIEIPHPGMSYNPSLQAHKELMDMIAKKEETIINHEKHLDRVTKLMFTKTTPQQRDSEWIEEMSQGLADKNIEENPDSDTEYKPINPPVLNKKKSKKQKRKQKEQKDLKLVRKKLRMEKKKITDLHHLKEIEEKLKENAKQLEKLREERRKSETTITPTKRLGALKFEEKDLECNMISDLSGNLRNLKQEGYILTDRFKSMQKRNIIKPSKVVIKKKAKMKRFVKNDHKADWMKTVAKCNNFISKIKSD